MAVDAREKIEEALKKAIRERRGAVGGTE